MTEMNRPDQPFRPVFCHRDDCKASRTDAYCAACGADVGAYLQVTADVPAVATPGGNGHEALAVATDVPTQSLATVTMTPVATSPPPLGAAHHGGTTTIPPPATDQLGHGDDRRWLTWLNAAVFTGALTVGAVAAVTADFI
jgi:hypothetical protein